ncbi:MAG: acylphosphatase [Deltaproteobacteria bacterium]|nr:acylphosphatase [Deltaproteobacteria bacterium]MBI4197222.1 acylphosphatase [Deltaproteobacteria bacterium]
MEKVRAHLVISGRVQGVCFRACTEEEATRRHLTGWVRNTEEGKVEVVVEGESEPVRQLIDWCHEGPPTARVSKVEVTLEKFHGDLTDFRIVR